MKDWADRQGQNKNASSLIGYSVDVESEIPDEQLSKRDTGQQQSKYK